MIFALEWVHPQPPSSFSFLLCSDSLNALDGVRDHHPTADWSRIPNEALLLDLIHSLLTAGYHIDFRKKSTLTARISLWTREVITMRMPYSTGADPVFRILPFLSPTATPSSSKLRPITPLRPSVGEVSVSLYIAHTSPPELTFTSLGPSSDISWWPQLLRCHHPVSSLCPLLRPRSLLSLAPTCGKSRHQLPLLRP